MPSKSCIAGCVFEIVSCNVETIFFSEWPDCKWKISISASSDFGVAATLRVLDDANWFLSKGPEGVMLEVVV